MTDDAPHHGLRWLPFLQPARPQKKSIRKPADGVARKAEPQIMLIAAGEGSCPVVVQRHRLARRYALRIHAKRREAVLSMPLRGNLVDARDFVERHADWLAERLRRLPDLVAFADGACLPLRGEMHRIVHRPRMRGTVWLEADEDGARLVCVAGDAAHLSRRVTDYLKREARRELSAAARRYAGMLGVDIRRIGVRDQSSRWGSCNTDGVLSFSWRLILAPPEVLDYLAAHEVAHLVEMNHSPRFWHLVDRICPEMEQAKAWLDRHGNDLHRYGAGK